MGDPEKSDQIDADTETAEASWQSIYEKLNDPSNILDRRIAMEITLTSALPGKGAGLRRSKRMIRF